MHVLLLLYYLPYYCFYLHVCNLLMMPFLCQIYIYNKIISLYIIFEQLRHHQDIFHIQVCISPDDALIIPNK